MRRTVRKRRGTKYRHLHYIWTSQAPDHYQIIYRGIPSPTSANVVHSTVKSKAYVFYTKRFTSTKPTQAVRVFLRMLILSQ